MKKYKQAVWILIAVLFMIYLLPLHSTALEDTKIRVGFYDDGDYMSRNEDGQYVGFNIEYLQQIAKYSGLEYEIIDAGSWENSLNMLRNHEIDLLPAVYYTEEREKEFLFSAVPMCNIYTTLNVRLDDTRYGYEDFDSFTGMKVGIIQNGKDGESFKTYCNQNGISVDIVPYLETPDLLYALENKELDGVAITHLGRNSTFKSIAQFAPEPIYVITSKNNSALQQQINNAQNIMRLRDPYYDTKIYEKYFSVNTMQAPVFTKEEQAYIKTAGNIRTVYNASWEPLEYADSSNGAFSGVTADLFRLIAQDSGLNFEFIAAPNHTSAIEAIKEGKAEVICSMANDYLWAAEHKLNVTGYYLRAPLVVIKDKNIQIGERIALPTGFLYSQKIAENNPGKQIQYYSSIKECFDAVLQGNADVTYANTYISNYLLSDSKYEKFSVVIHPNYTEEIGIGISESADPHLFSILDKCVQYTANEKIEEMVLKNSLVPRKVTWQDIVHQYQMQIIIGVLLIFGSITLVLSYTLVMKSRSHRRIQNLLYQDGLTGIWNLSKFRIEAKQLLEKMGDIKYAVIYMDINQFKTINDVFGFSEGDQILCSLANILQKNITEQECCARVSADQFVLLLQYHTWEQLEERTNKIDKQMNEFLKARGKTYYLCMVFGVYIVEKKDEYDMSLVLDFANYARRSQKNSHKSITVVYDETMREEELEQRHLSDIMETALKNGEFIPYYQPKVNMRTNEVVGAEALVRWIRPNEGMVLPGTFIPFFERNGFVIEVDLYMYEQVCIAIRSWLDKGKSVKVISCNFSRLHFSNDKFPQIISEIADKYQIPHEYLELEITESIVMEDMTRVQKLLKALKKKGFSISIDDFGSGYSSLGLLEQLPVDVLKLDRSFLTKGAKEKEGQIIIRGIISMAQQLNVTIVCEGIETKEQGERLMCMNCLIAQGFYYAKPMPKDEFEKMF